MTGEWPDVDAQGLLTLARESGITLKVEGDRLMYHPASVVPEDFVQTLRQHKAEVMELLTQDTAAAHTPANSSKQVSSEPATSREEAEETARRLERYGCVLLHSEVLEDFIAFYKTDEDRSKIPTGFVPYSKDELEKLFAESPPSRDVLKRIHEAKRQGARVIDHGRGDTAE
jgi:hypothetical protein